MQGTEEKQNDKTVVAELTEMIDGIAQQLKTAEEDSALTNGADQLKRVKAALILAFKHLYTASLEKWRVDFNAQSLFESTVPDLAKRPQLHKELEKELNKVLQAKSIQESVDAILALDNPSLKDKHLDIDSVFNRIGELIDVQYLKKILEQKLIPKHHATDLEPCIVLFNKVLQINLDHLKLCIPQMQGIISSSLTRRADVADTDNLIAKELLAEHLRNLINFSKDAFKFSNRLRILEDQSAAAENQYLNDNIATCIPKTIFATQQALAHLDFIKRVKAEIIQNMPNFTVAVKAADDEESGIRDFFYSFYESCARLHAETQEHSPYTFALDYMNAATVADVLEEGKVATLKDIDAEFRAFREFQKQLLVFSKELGEVIITAGKFKECSEAEVYDHYLALAGWFHSINTLKALYPGQHRLSEIMDSGIECYNIGIDFLLVQLEKPMYEMLKNLDRFNQPNQPNQPSLQPSAITHAIETIFKQKLSSLDAMGIRLIKNEKVAELDKKYKALYAEKLATLIGQRSTVLVKQLTDLEQQSAPLIERKEATALLQLLARTKADFDNEIAFQKPIRSLCLTLSCGDLTAYEELVGKVVEMRAAIKTSSEEIQRESTLEALSRAQVSLRTLIAQSKIDPSQLKQALDTLYARVEAYAKVALDLNGKTADEVFNAIVAEILSREAFKIDSLNDPTNKPMSFQEYSAAASLVAALNNPILAKYADREFISMQRTLFAREHETLLGNIAGVRRNLEAKTKEIQSCTADTYNAKLEEFTILSKYVCQQDNHFLTELMKKENELALAGFNLLATKKAEFEAVYNDTIAQLWDEIVETLTAVSVSKNPKEDLQSELILQKQSVILEKLERASRQGLQPDLSASLPKIASCKSILSEKIIAKRCRHFNNLIQKYTGSLTDESLKKLKDFLAFECDYATKLKSICYLDRFSMANEYQAYATALVEFTKGVNNLEFNYEFSGLVDELKKINNVCLDALDEQQKNHYLAIFGALNQKIVILKRLYTLDQFTNYTVDRLRKLVTTMREILQNYAQQHIESLMTWLKQSTHTPSKIHHTLAGFQQKMDDLAALDQRTTDLLNSLVSQEEQCTPFRSKTLTEIFEENKHDRKFVYSGNLKVISNEKWVLLDKILRGSTSYNFTRAAGFWTTATGIKQLRSLKTRWDRFQPDQKKAFLDDYFSQVAAILDLRLACNPDNRTNGREKDTHKFYTDSYQELTSLVSKQRENWALAIDAALQLGDYKAARQAMIDMRPKKEELLNLWIALTYKTLVAIFNDSRLTANDRNQPILSALSRAEKELAVLPIASRLAFYDQLSQHIEQQAPNIMPGVQSLLLVLRTAEDAKDPERADHAWWGRATGVAQIHSLLGKPKEILATLKANPNKPTQAWKWIKDLIKDVVQVITERLRLTKENPSRRVETTQFYDGHNTMYAQLAKKLGGSVLGAREDEFIELDAAEVALSADQGQQKKGITLIPKGDVTGTAGHSDAIEMERVSTALLTN